jgi:hypothetical protein
MVFAKIKILGIAFMETSAKEKTNVQIAFERVLQEIYNITTKNSVKDPTSKTANISKGTSLKEKEPEEKRGGMKLTAENTRKKGKKGCC